MIYLDNNATTLMPLVAKKAMLEWCNRGNPSAGYAAANESRAYMNKFREYIATACGITSCCREARDDPKRSVNQINPSLYKIIFTSGASESNCTILRSVVDSYRILRQEMPHIIMSAVEHKSLYEMALHLVKVGLADITFIRPTLSGHVDPADVAAAITKNTCLICIMHANNETGAINDVRKIGAIAHKMNVPFYCDTAQTFGKISVRPAEMGIDAFSISFHKIHGPPGIGALVIKQQFLLGYHLGPMIFGTQNEGFRGGTENLPGIGASFAAAKYTLCDRSGKNANILHNKRYIMNELSRVFTVRSYPEYRNNPCEIVFLSGDGDDYLPGTLLLAVVKRTPPHVCNAVMKAELEKKNIVVSVGSACNTSSPKASHVLFAMDADEFVRKGALRITLGDETSPEDVKIFVKEFTQIAKKQLGKR